MLATGNYPYHLKRRIAGKEGHLSNTDALELFMTHAAKELQLLVLSHLSKNNNCPKLVQQLFDEHAGDVKMIIASRDAETPVYYITGRNNLPMHRYTSSQLSFSFA